MEFSKKITLVYFNASLRKWQKEPEQLTLKDYCYRCLRPNLAESLNVQFVNGKYRQTATYEQLLVMLKDADDNAHQNKHFRFDNPADANTFLKTKQRNS